MTRSIRGLGRLLVPIVILVSSSLLAPADALAKSPHDLTVGPFTILFGVVVGIVVVGLLVLFALRSDSNRAAIALGVLAVVLLLGGGYLLRFVHRVHIPIVQLTALGLVVIGVALVGFVSYLGASDSRGSRLSWLFAALGLAAALGGAFLLDSQGWPHIIWTR